MRFGNSQILTPSMSQYLRVQPHLSLTASPFAVASSALCAKLPSHAPFARQVVPCVEGARRAPGASIFGALGMAGENRHRTITTTYLTGARGNVLGANSWGSSFIVGDGSTFPNCIQHQVANLAGALDGTSGGTPILWGAASEGPASGPTSGTLGGMILCPGTGVDEFEIFNGNDGKFNRSQLAVYRDNVQSYSTTEPAIDLTSTSFLMFSWRLAGRPAFWTSAKISAHPEILSGDSRDSSTWLTATVKSTGHSGPKAMARFFLGSTRGTLLGEAQLQDGSESESSATLRVRASDLAPGANEIIVYFPGDNDHNGPSTSFPVLVTVK